MERSLETRRSPGGHDTVAIRRRIAPLVLSAALTCFLAGCHKVAPADTKPLDSAGMTYDSIRQLQGLDITPPEIVEVAAARQAGMSDSGCISILKMFRNRQKPFDAGAAVAGLLQAQMAEGSVLELARMNQLGLSAGEFQAMRLAGLSDATVLEVAKHRAENRPVLSGASLARLKNVGMRESTLLELARRGVPDSQANAISALRRRGASDKEVLRRFAGS